MGLLERILDSRNVRRAYEQVMANKGSGGVDGIEIEGFKSHVQAVWASVKTVIQEGEYQPSSVRKVEIPKPGGGRRILGIPTLLDRMIQQAIAQELTGLYDGTFSKSSYGFRPMRNAHQALVRARQYVNEGYSHVVDVDMAQFFDRVNHDYLMNMLNERITDKRVLKLIHRYLRAGAMLGGIARVNTEGTPQGGPLALRTHSQTLSLTEGLKLVEEGFNYFIKGIIFMINGTITERRISQAYQPYVYPASKGHYSTTACGEAGAEVWYISDTGLSLCKSGKRDQRENGDSGKFCGVYRQTTTLTDQAHQEVIRYAESDNQQSGPYCAGRIFSKEGSCQKRRDKLRHPLLMTVCGSRSYLRLTISSSRRTNQFSLRRIVMN